MGRPNYWCNLIESCGCQAGAQSYSLDGGSVSDWIQTNNLKKTTGSLNLYDSILT